MSILPKTWISGTYSKLALNQFYWLVLDAREIFFGYPFHHIMILYVHLYEIFLFRFPKGMKEKIESPMYI